MRRFGSFYFKYLDYVLVRSAFIALILNIVVEALSRHSLFAAFAFMTERPGAFFYNVLILFVFLSVAIFFKAERRVYFIVGGAWFAVAFINAIILINRMTPFTTKDLTVLGEGLSILTNYISIPQLILICVGIIAGVVGLRYLLNKIRPHRKRERVVRYKQALLIYLAILLSFGGLTSAVIHAGVVETFFGNLAYAYRDNGTPYCFLNTWINTGIDRPGVYSQAEIDAIFTGGEDPGEMSQYETADDGKKHPNIIFLQLESFIDPMIVKNIKLSQDPIPYFRQLSGKHSSGFLQMPALGAGTANSEFEVMSGISARFFGPGEYPYKAVLRDKTCETAAYVLKNKGYTAHALHNHRGAFYNRNVVFSNLGYDTFTSLEYMNHIVKTPKNWAKDAILTQYIKAALKSTKKQDFIFTISVQGHGRYPHEETIMNPAIRVEAPTEALKWQWEYYVNQIREMDMFVRDLCEMLDSFDEDVVLVMYGDHIPPIDISEEDLTTGDLYKTSYVVWSNFGLPKRDRDMYAYQIAADVFDRIGLGGVGNIFTYHQKYYDDPKYMENLKAIAYDILYGQRYLYHGKNPFAPTKLQMGINPIRIDEVVQIGDKYYIRGQNFTGYSKISLDGEVLDTIYLGPNILGLQEKIDISRVKDMKVSQVEKNDNILSTTE